jgi:urease accessory protein
MSAIALLNLLQLVSPALPVGAYSYSEGLETLISTGTIATVETLEHWLVQELRYGTIRLDGAVMLRAYDANTQLEILHQWNQWLGAMRETAELRQSSQQMGRALQKLLLEWYPELNTVLRPLTPCHYAIAFGVGAAYGQIPAEQAALGYLHSWLTHQVTAAVKLIPLGQTMGQQLLRQLASELIEAQAKIRTLADEDLYSCSWGLSFASIQHETQYTRLFRS